MPLGACILALPWLSTASASPVEFYGFGGRKMGRAGGGVALAEGAAGILSNPASLAGEPLPEASLGFVGVDAEFDAFPALWWDTDRDGTITEDDPPLDAGPAYDPIQGFLVGATRPIGRHVSLGFGLFLPVERLLRLQTFDPQVPTYFLYANRAQRYELALAAGVRPTLGIAVGGGVQIIPRARYKLDATLDIALSGVEEGDAAAGDVLALSLDVHTMSLDLVPGFAPILSLHWDAGEAVPALDGLELGGTWRGEAGLPVDVDIALQINAGTSGLGDAGDIVVPMLFAFQLGVFDHYVPERLDLGAAYTFAETLTLTLDARRTAWDQMQPSIARVTHATVNGAAIELSAEDIEDGNPYDIVLEPTWSPRAGAELLLPGFRLPGGLLGRLGEVRVSTRGGLGYEPSPLVQQSAATALLDADRYVFAVGLGIAHDDPFRREGVQRRGALDGFFQYHVLADGQLDRGTPAEPTAGYARDGSPIPIGGHLLAAGAEWSFEY